MLLYFHYVQFLFFSIFFIAASYYGFTDNKPPIPLFWASSLSAEESVWTKGGTMFHARTEVSGEVLNGRIYIVGGLSSEGRTTDIVEVYNPQTGKWTSASPLPVPLDHTAVATYGGRLYVVGGYEDNRKSTNKLFIYDPITDRWKEGPSLPMARGALTANFIDGVLYAVGGEDSSHKTVTTNQVYDPIANTWTEKSPMPTARHHLTSEVVDGKLYVIGGRQSGNGYAKVNVDSNEVYDPKKDSWNILKPMPTKRSGLDAAAPTVGGSIYVFGGENPFKDEGPVTTFDNVEKYDPKANEWTLEDPMPTSRHGLAAVYVDGKIYVIGGGPEPGLTVTNVNEVFHVGKDDTNS